MPKSFGAKLHYLRLSRHFTQMELAEKLGHTGQAHVANLEVGRTAPSLELIIRIAICFGATADYLLRDTIAVDKVTIHYARPHGSVSNLLSFGSRLRALRVAEGWTQAELAQRLESTRRSDIGNLEDGRKMPTHELLIKIADVFSVTVDTLLGISDGPETSLDYN